MFTEKEGAIALLEERLEKAKRALEFCADGFLTQEVQLHAAHEALAAIWPTPPKPRVIEVGGVYTLKNLCSFECCFIHDDFAHMVRDGRYDCPAYVWNISGKSLSLNENYDIDWSRS